MKLLKKQGFNYIVVTIELDDSSIVSFKNENNNWYKLINFDAITHYQLITDKLLQANLTTLTIHPTTQTIQCDIVNNPAKEVENMCESLLFAISRLSTQSRNKFIKKYGHKENVANLEDMIMSMSLTELCEAEKQYVN